jgi:hypothetical protein
MLNSFAVNSRVRVSMQPISLSRVQFLLMEYLQQNLPRKLMQRLRLSYKVIAMISYLAVAINWQAPLMHLVAS